MDEQHTETGRGRRRRDRARTESDLLAATERLVDRDGVLAGVNLNEVAADAGVNRAQIYQLFSDRRTLLRAALAHALDRFRSSRPPHWEQTFAARKKSLMQATIAEPRFSRYIALLLLDGDEAFRVFPALHLSRAANEHDKATGALPADADSDALHVLANATCLGYALMREAAAREIGATPDELDHRAAAAYAELMDAVTERQGRAHR